MAQIIDATPNVVYRGQIIRVQVPQYCRSSAARTQASSGMRTQCHSASDDVRRRRCGGGSLLEATNRYHSESDLVEAAVTGTNLADDEHTSHRPRHKDAHRKVADQYAPRTIVLRKNGGTFGFLLCGTTSAHAGSLHGLNRPTPEHPASQYFDSVQKGSAADNAGLRTGDFLLEINGENVTTASHSHTVQLIRSSGDAICLKIITPPRRSVNRPWLLAEHLAVGWRCLSSGPPRTQRHVNKTPGRNIASSSQTAENQLQREKHAMPRLTTARSMPDLSAAEDHTPPYENVDNWTGKLRKRSADDYRDHVLYELTSQLRPSTQPLDASSAQSAVAAQQTDDDNRTTPQCRPDTNLADHSASPQRRPAPPPRGTSISSRIHPPTSPTVSSLTASRAKSTGSELRELLDNAGTSSRAQHSVVNSPSTAARSTISGEHLVLPSQLKKLQRPNTNDQTPKDDKVVEETRTNYEVKLLNGDSSDVTRPQTNAAVEQHRSPVPKRPAPPPPSLKTTASPATNGEVNFLVMAEQARQQYILAKLARKTLIANSTTDTSQANGHHRADARHAGHGLHDAANSLTTVAEINGESAKGGGLQAHLLTSNGTSSPQANVKASPATQKDDRSLSAHPLLAPSEIVQTQSPPTIPPKRRPRNNSRTGTKLGNSETADSERQSTSSVDENGTGSSAMDGLLQSQMSTNKVKQMDMNITQETSRQHDNNEHGRRSNAKLIRGKNVQVRRSGASRLSSVIYHNVVVNDTHSPINGHKSGEDAEENERQLLSMCDVGVLPPPPDFAD